MILSSFNIPLPPKLGKQVQAEWEKHGKTGGAMVIAQPVTTWGPFHLRTAALRVAIVTPDTMQAIQAAIEAGNEPAKAIVGK